jgi:hypothetical protein
MTTGKRIRLLIFSGTILLVFLLSNGHAYAQSFIPSADSYIHDANPAVNYGTLPDLIVKKGTSINFRKAYIKFDLSASGISVISSAIVRLYSTTSLAVDMNVHQVGDAWTETGITWSNAPAEGTIISTVSLPATPGYNEWDITTYVQSQFLGNDKVISLVFYSAAVTSGTITFSSKEAVSNLPELVVVSSPTIPSAPTALSASLISSNQVDLSWEDNANNESGFIIERKTASGSFMQIDQLPANQSAYNDANLSSNTIYTYRVYAYNAVGNSPYSNEAPVTTPPAPSVPVPPSNLTATAGSSSSINLQWIDNSEDESGFRVEYNTGNGIFSEVATLGPDITAFSHNGLPGSTMYTYRIQAYNVTGSSAYSNEASATTPAATGTSYYIDPVLGNDTYNGLTPSTAWKTLAKVNVTTFLPGNKILFKAGGVWTGRLYPKGSGVSGSPIIIDMYGSGNKPLIDGNGLIGTGVVYLYNQQYWEINNLEITNNAANEGDRRGVRIEAENYGTANHIYLKNLDIHNIKGSVGQTRANKRTGGIGFGIVDVSTQETHFNDILVENCVITDCENQGIITECVTDDGFDPYSPEWNSMKITNAVIRNNTISGISKNAMIIRLFENGIVEHNVCYNTANGISGNTMFTAACSGTVFQYNEGYDNNSPDADGSMYDADLRSPNTIWQYSYSHDNAHGLFWTCTVQADANVICRYNISQNDQGIIFCINYPVTSVHVYNNTVYIPSNLSPLIISERNNGGSGTRTYTFKNNLVYNLSPTAVYDYTTGYNRTIDYNCFYGIHPSSEPADPHKVTGDPKLLAPGSGGIGLNTVGGYKLQAGSSCINKGTAISGNGGFDYWGNPLYNGLPDIGVHEYTLPPAAPTGLNAVAVLPSQANLTWNDNAANESGYSIERKTGTGSFTQIALTGPDVTSYVNTGISANVEYTYRIRAVNASGNSAYSNEALIIIATSKNLIISDFFLQGLYIGEGTMRKAQDETGDYYPGNIADVVTIELHNATSYGMLEFSVTDVSLNTDGSVSVSIPSDKAGNYYITIRHRNSIATTSSIPVSFSGNTTQYNFDQVEKAFGGNLVSSGDGNWLVYSGDNNQDGIIDSMDMILNDNSSAGMMTGYLVTDINGDGITNDADMNFIAVNAGSFVSVKTP